MSKNSKEIVKFKGRWKKKSATLPYLPIENFKCVVRKVVILYELYENGAVKVIVKYSIRIPVSRNITNLEKINHVRDVKNIKMDIIV